MLMSLKNSYGYSQLSLTPQVIFPSSSPSTPGLAKSQSRPLAKSLHLTDPMGYLEFNYLVEHAFAVITDSGGITEETTVMGVPCMTARP